MGSGIGHSRFLNPLDQGVCSGRTALGEGCCISAEIAPHTSAEHFGASGIGVITVVGEDFAGGGELIGRRASAQHRRAGDLERGGALFAQVGEGDQLGTGAECAAEIIGRVHLGLR